MIHFEKFPVCPKCKQTLKPSSVEGYAYQCMQCDEDFYSIECPNQIRPVLSSNEDDIILEEADIRLLLGYYSVHGIESLYKNI